VSNLRSAAQQAREVLRHAVDELSRCGQVAAILPCTDAIEALRAAMEQTVQPNPWRDAVDHELSTLHMVASDDPQESIRRLIDWHCAVQIDPLVSSAAQELIERGRREALEQPVRSQKMRDAGYTRREWQRDELLEALRQIAKIGNQPYGTDYEEIDKAREIARAAIAKVEGTK
jgi:hypothetical protein